MLMEFYSWTIDYVMGLTVTQYSKVFDEMNRIRNIEAGVKEEQPMGGTIGASAASHLLPRKEQIYGKTR